MAVQSIFGLLVFVGLAWAISENRRNIRPMTILTGIGLQIGIGLLLLKISIFREFFMILNHVVTALEESTSAGTSFVFGYLGGSPLPFEEKLSGASFILAFKALPLILFISALSSLLFYLKILPFVVKVFSWGFRKTMGIGGAEGLSISADIFVGMVEAPLLIRPYLDELTRSELFSVMTCGMATIAGTVMVLYASILGPHIPNVMGHILTASIMSVPASLVVSKVMVPQTGKPTAGELKPPQSASSAMDALSKGTLQGVELLINIMAMLVVLVAVVHLINLALGLFPTVGGIPLTMQRCMGVLMAPIVWLMGVPWSESMAAGSLMGTKTILNELLAYLEMAHLGKGVLSPRTYLIMTYAMCGFANPGSLGILIGGIGTMAPGRRDEIVSLGFKSIISGTLATCMSGAVVNIIA
jgi:concentrative nucleoside transporter, CNT family